MNSVVKSQITQLGKKLQKKFVSIVIFVKCIACNVTCCRENHFGNVFKLENYGSSTVYGFLVLSYLSLD